MTPGPGGSADAGLANERTALAWQRTALSLLAGAAVMARLSWTELGLVGFVPLGAAVLLSGWVFLESGGRYRRDPATGRRLTARGGRAHAALALAVVLLAVTELAALLMA